jgi:hypothetical protein
MYRPHFVYLLVHQWTLGLLLLLTVVNNATIKMIYRYLLPVFNLFGYIFRSGISRPILFLIFWGTATLLLLWWHHFTMPQSMPKGSIFSTSVPALAIFCFSVLNSLRVWTQGLVLLGRCCTTWAMPQSLFSLVIFWVGSQVVVWGWPQTSLLPVRSCVARIIMHTTTSTLLIEMESC